VELEVPNDILINRCVLFLEKISPPMCLKSTNYTDVKIIQMTEMWSRTHEPVRWPVLDKQSTSEGRIKVLS